MKAICYNQFGGYDQLGLAEMPTPIAKSGNVLVKMTAAAVNPGDNMIRAGHFPLNRPLPMVPGFEGAGVVVDGGSPPMKPGTRVMFTGLFGVVDDGTWREYVSVPQQALVEVPSSLTPAQAAGVPVAYLTAYLSAMAGSFKRGSRVLVSAVGGGVGNAAVQLTRAMGASVVITTAGSTAKATHARELGYENVIDLSREKLRDRVMDLTGGAGVDLVLDGIGGSFTAVALGTVANHGKHVVYGASGGANAEICVFDLIGHSSSLVGLGALVTQPNESLAPAYDTIIRLLAEKKILPTIARVFPLEQAAEAQRYLAEERPFGKVILEM